MAGEILHKFNSRTYIIAEAGVNHNGSMDTAVRLIDAAWEAGADAVKFQTFKADRLVTKSADKAEYQKRNSSEGQSQFEMLKKLELSEEQHYKLLNHCRNRGMEFLSTPFDCGSADFLERLGMSIFKVSSGDLTNMPLLKHLARKNKCIILSTGMASLEEVEEAVDWAGGGGHGKLVLLHCTTAYPTEVSAVNLKAIVTLRDAVKLPVGYSDHTRGIEVAIAAAAMGACVIEKHFTLDRQMEGPDHAASLEPEELKKMVQGIRNVEAAMGDGVKKAVEDELGNLIVARKSVVAARDIQKGQQLTVGDIDIKRPATGIAPKHFFSIVGRIAKRDIKEDEILQWQDFV